MGNYDWPSFAEAGWTAVFESYDQYREHCYYRVAILDDGREVETTVAKISLDWDPNGSWDTPEWIDTLRSRLAAVVATVERPRQALPTALDHCERPDEAIRIALATSPDRKRVIHRGVFAAKMFSSTSDLVELFAPWPRKFEAIEQWCGDPPAAPDLAYVRSLCAGSLFAIPLAMLVNFVVGSGYAIMVVLTGVFCGAFTLAMKPFLAWLVRRQLARLDEQTALQLVLGELARGIVKRPEMVPMTMHALRRHLANDAGLAPPD